MPQRHSQQAAAARHRHMTGRIVKAWHAANAEHLAAGRVWYDRARATAHELSIVHSTDVQTAAAVIACLSPRSWWSVNVRWSGDVLRAAAQGRPCPVVSTSANRAKAWAFATGRAIPTPDAPEFGANAPKVRRFFANIMGDEQAVTVDMWAARVAEGRHDVAAPAGRRYQAIEAAYQAAAAIVGTSPRDVQAATWVALRGATD